MGCVELRPYQQLIGKWRGTPYEVIKKIGQGGFGQVYLVRNLNTGGLYALKMTNDNISINREYQLINELKNIEIVINAYEIDDLEIDGQLFYFICLDYIDGMNLDIYLKKRTISLEVILGLMVVIVEGLIKIHENGYILGDVKLDNIMLDRVTKELRIIDLGGVVKKGETINEFTPSYDRAKWQCGSRIAAESYDLFIVTMIIIRLIFREEFNPRVHNINDIIKKINALELSEELKSFLIKGLLKEQQSNCFAKDLRKIYNGEKQNRQSKKKNSKFDRINIIFISSVSLLITTTLYIMLRL